MRSSLLKPWIRFVVDGVDGGGSEASTSTASDDSSQEGAEASFGDTSPEPDDSDDGDDDDGGAWDSARAMAKIKKINAENKRLRDRAKEAETQAEKSAQELKSENTSLQARALRLEVAVELGLPKALAERLQGGTREEITADAEALLNLVGPSKPGGTRPGNAFGENHSNGSKQGPIDYEAMVAHALNP